VQWQMAISVGSPSYEMRMAPQRQEPVVDMFGTKAKANATSSDRPEGRFTRR